MRDSNTQGAFASRLVRDLKRYHAADLDDKTTYKAVIVKAVALCVLAFDMPAKRGEPDYVEAVEKLLTAITILDTARKAKAWDRPP